MNTPKNTPEDNELILAFESYDFIVTQTDPTIEELHETGQIIPSYIKNQVNEFKEWSAVPEITLKDGKVSFNNPTKKCLSSSSINQLLIELVKKNIPLYMVGDKEISCVSDIKKLWEEIGLKYNGGSRDRFDRKRVCAVKAYLEPQRQRIIKELTSKLKPEKQSETVDISQGKTGKDFVPFPTPSGTQWHEVKISFIDNENVCISIKGKTKQVNYASMGFTGKKRGNPSKLWFFLKELAVLNGRFKNYPLENKVEIKELFSDLRKKLIDFFKFDGDPIPYLKTKDYTGYKTTFVIEDKSHAREYEESVIKHNKKYVPSRHKQYKESVDDDRYDSDDLEG